MGVLEDYILFGIPFFSGATVDGRRNTAPAGMYKTL